MAAPVKIPYQKMRFLDWAVLVVMSLVLLFSVIIVVIGRGCTPWLEQHFQAFSVAAVLTCILLLAWMLRGGVDSALWAWMPPFCMVSNTKWVRWLVVIGMCIGTLIGILARFTGDAAK